MIPETVKIGDRDFRVNLGPDSVAIGCTMVSFEISDNPGKIAENAQSAFLRCLEIESGGGFFYKGDGLDLTRKE